MKSIDQIQEEIISEFDFFDDWTERYEYIIELGKSIPQIDEKYKTEEHLVRGCQSQVWLNSTFENGLVSFQADSDAVITKGIIGLLIRVLSGHTPEEIVGANLYFIDKINLRTHLSPTRSNGLTSMLKHMKAYALAFRMKPESHG